MPIHTRTWAEGKNVGEKENGEWGMGNARMLGSYDVFKPGMVDESLCVCVYGINEDKKLHICASAREFDHERERAKSSIYAPIYHHLNIRARRTPARPRKHDGRSNKRSSNRKTIHAEKKKTHKRR